MNSSPKHIIEEIIREAFLPFFVSACSMHREHKYETKVTININESKYTL